MLTRSMAKELGVASAHECLFVDFLSEEEPKKVSDALQYPGWLDAMQDELNQFARNKVWTLVPAPYGKTIISLKWVFRNKRDETRIVIKNQTRLIAQGYNQQEGIDYDETFAPVARLEAIKIFLAFATYMNFIVYQMDVKSAFLNVPIFCDNTSAIAISNNPVLHSRMKHIDIRYHFIRDHILKGYIELHFIPTQYQLADIFTKPLDEPTFKRLIVELVLTVNPTQIFSVHNWALKPNQTEGPPFTNHMKAICNLDVPVDPKAPKPFSQTEEVPQGKKLGAKSGLRRKQSLKHTSAAQTEASKSKLANQKKKLSLVRPRTKAQAILHLPLYFFHLHYESASGHDALADSTNEADPGLSAPNDSIPS
ncbi:retrovirus-related pol polyprotein from transposon TNT 1-94 [Tanacetum coccineum]